MKTVDLTTIIRLEHPDQALREVVDELVYSSYRFNRDRSPEISAERWARLWPDTADAMENRYQAEKKGCAA